MMTKDEALEFTRQFFEKKNAARHSDGRDVARFVMMVQSGFHVEPIEPLPAPTMREAMALDVPILQARFTAERIAPLLQEAETDRLAHKAACEVAAGLLSQGAPLPPALAKFAADALRGSNVPKGRRGTDKREDLVRNQLITDAVSQLQELGIPPTRNNATLPGNCGCDTVAEVLNLSYDAIAKIWKSRQK
ncbi:MAG: hypothetical protein ACOY41_06640 [Pseudomonadota bacterium]